MTAELKILAQPNKGPNEGLIEGLRGLLAAAERGEVQSMVAMVEQSGEYHSHCNASLNDRVVMSALLHRTCMDRMFER